MKYNIRGSDMLGQTAAEFYFFSGKCGKISIRTERIDIHICTMQGTGQSGVSVCKDAFFPIGFGRGTKSFYQFMQFKA